MTDSWSARPNPEVHLDEGGTYQGPPLRPVSARATAVRSSLIQFANVVSLIPTDLAISTLGRSDVFTSSTASRRNSGGYFDGRHNVGSFP